MNNNLLNLAIKKVAKELCIPYNTAELIYKSYWAFVRNYIEDLPIRKMSEEEFNKETTNFNIPYIGKLYVDYSKIEKYKRQLKRYEDARDKKNQANRLSSISD